MSSNNSSPMKRNRSDSRDITASKLVESSDQYMYVVLEVPYDVSANQNDVLSKSTFDIESFNGPTPIVTIDNKRFKGEYKSLFGSQLVFEKNVGSESWEMSGVSNKRLVLGTAEEEDKV